MSYFLGVDAGGTKTTFVLADEERELARAQVGTIKRMRTDEATAARNLQEALGKLRQRSGVDMRAVTQTCVGTAGEKVALVVDWLRAAFSASVGGGLEIVGDVEVALDAAFHGGPGVLVLAGTGSNVAGRSRSGEIFTAGGWGPQMADQGSGHFIGLEALRRGFLALDQDDPRRRTQLLDKAIEHWQLTSLGALVEFANARPAPDYSRLAPLVADCAAQGDVVAAEVLEKGGKDLASLAGLVIERMRSKDGAEFRLPGIAYAGSVLEHIQAVRVALHVALLGAYPEIQVQPAATDPVLAALWRRAAYSPRPSRTRIASRKF